MVLAMAHQWEDWWGQKSDIKRGHTGFWLVRLSRYQPLIGWWQSDSGKKIIITQPWTGSQPCQPRTLGAAEEQQCPLLTYRQGKLNSGLRTSQTLLYTFWFCAGLCLYQDGNKISALLHRITQKIKSQSLSIKAFSLYQHNTRRGI